MENTDFKALKRTETKMWTVYSTRLDNLTYDEGFFAKNPYDGVSRVYGYEMWSTPGAVAESAAQYGLPSMVRGDSLGCGCAEAHLHGISKVKDGQIETDYMCDYGYHNFMVFRVKDKQEQKEVHLQKDGTVTDEKGFTAGNLNEF